MLNTRHIVGDQLLSEKIDVKEILRLANKIKHENFRKKLLTGKTVVWMYEKPSLRTDVSIKKACISLGIDLIVVDKRSAHSFEDKKDVIRVVMQTDCDCLIYRAMDVKDVDYGVAYSDVLANNHGLSTGISVVDACSQMYHPMQALADIMTMSEHAGGIDKISKVAWIGMKNNVLNSLMQICFRLGIHLSIAPTLLNAESYDQTLCDEALQSGFITEAESVDDALNGARFVHTDTYIDMQYIGDGGVPKLEYRKIFTERLSILKENQITLEMIEAYPNAKFMHCMPVHAGYEITQSAKEHQRTIIFDQADNRLHVQKAVLVWLFHKEYNYPL